MNSQIRKRMRSFFTLILAANVLLYENACTKTPSATSATSSTGDSVKIRSADKDKEEKQSILTSIADSTPPLWTESIRHLQLGHGSTPENITERLCPEIAEVTSQASADEFEKKEKAASVLKVQQKCHERFKSQKLPALATIELKIIGRKEYDFQKELYWLAIEEKVDDLIGSDGWGLWGIEYDRGCFGNTCILSELALFETSIDSSFARNTKDKLTYVSHIAFPVPEANAKSYLKRLNDNSLHRKLQIVFEPKPAKEGTPIGRAIGYRVLDDTGVLIPWTLFRKKEPQ